jgi:hypothetical protein
LKAVKIGRTFEFGTREVQILSPRPIFNSFHSSLVVGSSPCCFQFSRASAADSCAMSQLFPDSFSQPVVLLPGGGILLFFNS